MKFLNSLVCDLTFESSCWLDRQSYFCR